MSKHQFDAIIIGSGPAGEGAAMCLAKSGKSVAIVEQHNAVGGGCTHWGTIPSKAVRHGVQRIADYRNSRTFQELFGHVDVTYPEVLKGATSVIDKQVNMRRDFYLRNRVSMLNGHASFLDKNTIEIKDKTENIIDRHTAYHFVVATGSKPYHPPDIDFTDSRIHDSDSILQITDAKLRSITIYGAGVVGSEYASIFGSLGFKVDLVNTQDRLLAFLDDEITDALGYHLRNQGVVIRHNEQFTEVETTDSGVIVHCKSGKKFKNDLLLWANGRSGNTQELGLDAVGIPVNHRGQIEVNENFQTNKSTIYAVGDVIGLPSLASASYDQGRFAGTHIVDGESKWRLIEDMPTGIYTNPEISSLGRTEKQLTRDKIPYEVGRAMFRNIARAQITGNTVGMVKILFHTETLEILGIHCFGEQASEIIHIGQAIMSQVGQANSIAYFADTTFNYPTMAEAYRVAALNGLNRLN